MSLLTDASLIVTPNAYKAGKLYSIIPTDGAGDLNVVRATTATRVNSDKLIEQVPYNLLLRSQEFDSASWAKVNSTITSNSVTAPNGTLTADTFNLASTPTSMLRSVQQQFTGSGFVYTASIYLKYKDRQFIQLDWGSGFNGSNYVNVDLINGTITQGVYTTANISQSNDGWYRVDITTTGISNVPYLYIWAIDIATASRASSSSGTGGYYIWGAQLVEGTSAKEYFPTTDRLNVPRFDYTNASCPSILVEPQRTNLALRSEEFDNATWTKTASTVTANATTSPSGTMTADKLVEDAANNQHRIDQTTTSVIGTNTFSVFAKKSERDSLWLRIGTSGAYFDLTNGTISGNSGVTASIENYGNNWYKCIITKTSSVANEIVRINMAVGINGTYLGNGTSGLYIWGAQLEQGSNATSYIPTVASAVTRNADVITKSNIFTENLITSNGGTLFLSLSKNDLLVRQSAQGIFLNQLINNTGHGLHIVNLVSSPSSGRLGVRKIDVNGSIAIYTTTQSELKLLLKWNGSSLDIFQNGIKVISNSSFLATNMQFLSFQSLDVVKNINNCILFPTALTDEQCINLTTL